MKKSSWGLMLFVVGIWLGGLSGMSFDDKPALDLEIIQKYFSPKIVDKFFSLQKSEVHKKRLLYVNVCGLVRELGFDGEVEDKEKKECSLKGISVREYNEGRSSILIIGDGFPFYCDYYIFLFSNGESGRKICYWVKGFMWKDTIEHLDVGFWKNGDLLYIKHTDGWGTGLRIDRLAVFYLTNNGVNELVDIPISGHFVSFPTKIDWEYRGTATFVLDRLKIVYKISVLGPRDNPYEHQDVIMRRIVFDFSSDGSLRFNPKLSNIAPREVKLLEGDDVFVCSLSDKCRKSLAMSNNDV